MFPYPNNEYHGDEDELLAARWEALEQKIIDEENKRYEIKASNDVLDDSMWKQHLYPDSFDTKALDKHIKLLEQQFKRL